MFNKCLELQDDIFKHIREPEGRMFLVIQALKLVLYGFLAQRL